LVTPGITYTHPALDATSNNRTKRPANNIVSEQPAVASNNAEFFAKSPSQIKKTCQSSQRSSAQKACPTDDEMLRKRLVLAIGLCLAYAEAAAGPGDVNGVEYVSVTTDGEPGAPDAPDALGVLRAGVALVALGALI
jgi:hypothetical protein